MGVYSEKVIRDVNEQLDPRAVLELIGYHTDKLQESAETFRGFCPVHRETVFRTLIVDKSKRTFRCMYSLCKGAGGGTLVELYSLARELPLEKAVEELAEHFHLQVQMPVDPEYLAKQIEVAENYLELGFLDDAEKVLREVVQADPRHEAALRGLLRVYEQRGEAEMLGQQHAQLAQLLLERGEHSAAFEHVKAWAELVPAAPRAHRLLGEYLLEQGQPEGALEEFMTAADLYSSEGDFASAIEAYKYVDSLRLDLVDVVPHVLQVYEQMGQPARAVEFLSERAEAAVLHADFARAATLLEQAMELDPQATSLRLRFCEVAILADVGGNWLPRVFESAEWFVGAGQPEMAVRVYESVLESHPANEVALAQLGQLFASLGKREEGLGLRVRKARLQWELHQVQEARRELEAVLSEDPTFIPALELSVEIERAEGEAARAAALYGRLASLRAASGDFAGAVSDYDRAAELDAARTQWRLERARTLEAWGATGNVRARQEAASQYEQLGDAIAAEDPSGAAELYARAEACAPPTASLMLKLARVSARLGRLDEARQALARACDDLIATGDADAAIAGARELAALAPEDHALQSYVIELLEVVGRTGEAVEQAMALAEAAARRGDAPRVIQYLDRALALDPTHVGALEALALHYHGTGDQASYCDVLLRLATANEQRENFVGAAAALERLVDERPDDVMALGRLANLYLRLGNVPKSRLCRLQLAEVHRKRGALESEREILHALLAEEPDDVDVLRPLIECEFALGHGEQACALAVQLARWQMERGFGAQARATLEQALAKEPDDLAANRMLFDLLRQSGAMEEAIERGLHLVELLHLYDQVDEAVAVFDQTTECAPTDPTLLRKYIGFLRELGRNQEADERLFASARRLRAGGQLEAAYQAMAELLQSKAPEPAELEELLAILEPLGRLEEFAERAVELARLYEAGGQGKKALTLLRRALKVTGGHVKLRRELAELYRAQGRDTEAVRELMLVAEQFRETDQADEEIEILRRAAGLAPLDVSVRLRLVEALLRCGERDGAALQLEDLAAAHMNAKNYDEALAVLDRLVEEFPERLGARRMRGEVYQAKGDHRRAEADFNYFYLQSLVRQADEYRARGDVTREAATLREALKLAPDDEALMRRTRQAEFDAGEPEAACATSLALAEWLRRNQRSVEALDLLRETFARVPASLVVAETLFAGLVAAGAAEEAIAVGKTLAEMLLAEGRRQEAVATFEQVHNLDPASERLEVEFTDFLERAGEQDRALERLLLSAGRALERGALEVAEARYREALRLQPECEAALEGLVEVAVREGHSGSQVEWLTKLAQWRRARGQHRLSTETLRRALAVAPDALDLRQLLVDWLLEADERSEAADELHALADCLCRLGRQADALAAEQRAVTLLPDDPTARRRLAEMFVMLNELERGVDEMEALSELYARRGEFPPALAVLEEAQRLMPTRLSVRKLKADLFERMGDSARAAQERRQFEVAKALQEAEAARAKNNFKAEERALRKAVQIAPHDESVWQRLLACYEDLGQHQAWIDTVCQLASVEQSKYGPQRARARLEEALAKFPNEELLLRRLFDVARELRDDAAVRDYGERLAALPAQAGDIDRALAVYDELLSYDPFDVELRLRVADFCASVARLQDGLDRIVRGGKLLLDNEHDSDAERLLQHGLELSPHAVACLQLLVDLYERTGRTQEFERRLLDLASALEQSGQLSEAVATARRLTLVSPENVAARQLLVRLLLAAGQSRAAFEEQLALVGTLRQLGATSQAVEAAREAVTMGEGEERARRMLAECLFAAGQAEAAYAELEELAKIYVAANRLEEALGVLDEILAQVPQRLSARIQRAELYARLGRAEMALEEYRAISATVAAAGASMPASSAPAPPAMPTLQIVPEYDFEHFVVGTNNNFAYATALAVARAPARAYNPLFIYSDVGLGKTHLVNAIANHILRENPNVRIIYTNSEDFTAEVVEAIQTNTIHQFRAKYKSVDLLIVDDVQFLAGKERAQEEFFHIFNALFQAKKQIVITSDRPPKDIARLEHRLLSRFGAGVIVDIAPPDYETRVAILNREVERGKLPIPSEIVGLIAEHVASNVRELKGALNQVMAMHTIQGKPIDEENVRQILASLYGGPAERSEPPDRRRKGASR